MCSRSQPEFSGRRLRREFYFHYPIDYNDAVSTPFHPFFLLYTPFTIYIQFLLFLPFFLLHLSFFYFAFPSSFSLLPFSFLVFFFFNPTLLSSVLIFLCLNNLTKRSGNLQKTRVFFSLYLPPQLRLCPSA